MSFGGFELPFKNKEQQEQAEAEKVTQSEEQNLPISAVNNSK